MTDNNLNFLITFCYISVPLLDTPTALLFITTAVKMRLCVLLIDSIWQHLTSIVRYWPSRSLGTVIIIRLYVRFIVLIRSIICQVVGIVSY